METKNETKRNARIQNDRNSNEECLLWAHEYTRHNWRKNQHSQDKSTEISQTKMQ